MRSELDTKLLKLQVIPCAGGLQESEQGFFLFNGPKKGDRRVDWCER